ncbi:phage antirepressor KilAC domain-containing protein [Bacillus cereus]|uniref:phage antirepressor KilAC domain-containing protein n=1 Tax=Bacillus cereus TaxID=1396 RepID=UPI003EE14653
MFRSKDSVTVSQIADNYRLSVVRLNKTLKNEKIQYKVNNQWLLNEFVLRQPSELPCSKGYFIAIYANANRCIASFLILIAAL